MNKQQILEQIKRTASDNGGRPLGARRFAHVTQIETRDWLGKYWARWGDALVEAGFVANQPNAALPREILLEKYAMLARELGHLPTTPELKLKRRADARFPSHNTLDSHIGRSKRERIATLRAFCASRDDCADVVRICDTAELTGASPMRSRGTGPAAAGGEHEKLGVVYLMRSGKYYKIGRSNSAGRRHYELSIQLPTPTKVVHVIETDDPPGIERYWHERFEATRRGGEWFELSAEDIRVFKKRKSM